MATGFSKNDDVVMELNENDEIDTQEDNQKITFLIDIINEDMTLDYFQNLRLDLLSENPMLRNNFVCQLGLLKLSQDSLSDRVMLTNHTIKL